MLKVILVRHANIDLLDPAPEDPPLNAAGRARAQALARIAGTAGITAIFTSSLIRTKQTVEPLAALLNIKAKVASDALISDLLSGPDGAVVLIAGHSNTVPKIIAALGAPPPPIIDAPVFDNLFVVMRGAPAGPAALVHLKY